MFDEPSSYLDVKQRLKVSRIIRDLLEDEICKYVIVVEHDLSILDYLSDFVCCLYGVQSVYGVVTMPFSVREGINIFLSGFIKQENMRFRDFALSFKATEQVEDLEEVKQKGNEYPEMIKKFDCFELKIEAGSFQTSEIIVLLGENGTGKTTLVKILAGKDKEFKKKNKKGTIDHVSFKP